MSERPFMQLFVGDMVGDTLDLTAEQFGAYLLILMRMWTAGGSLPDDDNKLATIARMSVKKWRAVSPNIMAYFDRADGSITNRRLTMELRKGEGKTLKRSDAGARGGRANALRFKKRGEANASALPKHLPEPYRKSAEAPLANGRGSVALSPNAPTVKLNQLDPLFALIARIRGRSPPTDKDGCWTFRADEVEQARALA
jgi:uncharacterized protein YdaU (DUF1376 family)